MVSCIVDVNLASTPKTFHSLVDRNRAQQIEFQ